MNEKKRPEIENGERLYTAEELENIVEQRLSRERKNNESFVRIRELLGILRKKEPFMKLSNAAVAEKLAELVNNSAESEETDKRLPEANPDAVGSDFSELGNDAYDAEKNAEAAPMFSENAEKMRRMRELSEFLTIYGEDKLKSVMDDRAFHSFCVGKTGDIMTLYGSYCDFLDDLGHSPDAKRYRAAERGLASTGFSGNASTGPDYGGILTETQKRIAEAAGMSYRQYAELLAQIPTKRVGQK